MKIYSSLLHNAFGPRGYDCTDIRYKDSAIILNIQNKSKNLHCSHCKSHNVVKNGYVWRDIKTVPAGRKAVILHVKVQRLRCRTCGHDQQESLHFTSGKQSYSHSLRDLVLDLASMMTLKDVAAYLRLSWDTVKDIHKRCLKQRYGWPDLRNVRNIGIDEIAVHKGLRYKTIVIDLDTGRIIYVGDGKGADALHKFWIRVDRAGTVIEHISTDMSHAYTASIMENAPLAIHVYDHFHVVKLMNDALSKLRSRVYDEETRINRQKVLKGTRWLLLRNSEDIRQKAQRKMLDRALRMNEPLAKAYYLKENLRLIWMQPNKITAENELDNWIQLAWDAKIPLITKVANTIAAHRTGILAWYDCGFSNGKVEGINNKIKVLKRNAYGFRDEEYFKLRLFALHEHRITAFVG